MKKLSILLLLATIPLAAQEKEHNTGITFGVGQSSSEFSARRLFGNQWAALGVLGYSYGDLLGYNPGVGSVNVTTWSLGLAARRYFSPEPLRPFAELGVGMRRYEFTGCNDYSNPYGTAGGGVEYKIAPRVSIEGTAGLNYSSISQRCSAGGIEYNFDRDSWSTFRTALSITFYF